MSVYLLLVVSLLVLYPHCLGAGLKEEFTWSRISFVNPVESRYFRPNSAGGNKDSLVFPETGEPSKTTSPNDEYIYENNVPMGANRWKNKLFITVPRRRLGVPSSLNYVLTNSTERHNVPLIPYPDRQTNLLYVPPGQEHIVSVYRVAVDPCDRLWFVDTGIIELPGNKTIVQPQRLVIMDLNTDKIIKTHNFKESDLTPNTVLALVTVDVTKDKCDDAYAYFPDLGGFGLIVYSLKQDDSWRVHHNYFYLEPLAGEFNIGGQVFQWTDGIFSAALTAPKPDGFRDLIFHSMAGTHLYSVSTRILRDKNLATRSYHGNDFKVLGDRGEGAQTSASDLHKDSGVLFLALVNQNAIGCYNTNKPFKPENFAIVQKDDEKMIYPSDLKVSQDDVIVLTNTMPVFLYSKLNYDKTNFRVWINNVNEAIRGTTCEAQPTRTRY